MSTDDSRNTIGVSPDKRLNLLIEEQIEQTHRLADRTECQNELLEELLAIQEVKA